MSNSESNCLIQAMFSIIWLYVLKTAVRLHRISQGKITDCEFLALLQYEEGQNNNFVHSLIQANLPCTIIRDISIVFIYVYSALFYFRP